MKPRIPPFHGCLRTTCGAYDVNFLLYGAARSHKCQGWRVGPHRQGAGPSRADTRKEIHLMIGAPRSAAPPMLTTRWLQNKTLGQALIRVGELCATFSPWRVDG